MKFVLQPMSWYKRRRPDEPGASVVDVQVIDFQKQDNQYCRILARYDDGSEVELRGRIMLNRVYGDPPIEHWTVQGIDPAGRSIQLRLEENA